MKSERDMWTDHSNYNCKSYAPFDDKYVFSTILTAWYFHYYEFLWGFRHHAAILISVHNTVTSGT